VNKKEEVTSMKKYYNTKSIKDLEKIIVFFDEKICSEEDIKNNQIRKCYSEYVEKIKNEAEKGYLYDKISVNDFLLFKKKISINTYNTIWRDKLDSQFGDNIEINLQGEYVKLLKDLCYNNPTIENYYYKLIKWGDISPSMISYIVNNSDKLDLNSEEIRLFISIHYITISVNTQKD
jgi:hypothetical protein